MLELAAVSKVISTGYSGTLLNGHPSTVDTHAQNVFAKDEKFIKLKTRKKFFVLYSIHMPIGYKQI